ncbi:unnamed protein product, partial [Heterosigma akashiwo]
DNDEGHISFYIQANATTVEESKSFTRSCTELEPDPDQLNGRRKMADQTLLFPSGLELAVKSSENGGGTGKHPWRGGLILARQICSWFEGQSWNNSIAENLDISVSSFFEGKSIHELGAGSAGLPSMVLAECCK